MFKSLMNIDQHIVPLEKSVAVAAVITISRTISEAYYASFLVFSLCTIDFVQTHGYKLQE